VRALAVALLLVLAGCDERSCPDDEFVVNVAGTCAAGPTTVTLEATACQIGVRGPDGGVSPLPPQGELDQASEPLRKGGWQIWGPVCPASDPRCQTPTEFRRCFATRVQWHLELTCLDGTGAPVCKAELSE
jgi:hypothetical protein